MLCRNPFMVGAVPFGCGQCLPCRINRRRMWMWRMQLESLCHDESAFITLTYSDEFLPDRGSLVPKHGTDFLKRLRKAVEPTRIRYFLVGEYGDSGARLWNPHFHASIFGVGPWIGELLPELWEFGFTSAYEFNEQTAQYVAGYVTKKLTGNMDAVLDGRVNEFARMSRRPGLGAAAMAVIADQLHSDFGLDEIVKLGDVPYQLKMGNRSIPLGRYLREVLRNEMGVPREWRDRVKAKFFLERSAEMSALFEVKVNVEKTASTYKSAFVSDRLGAIRSVEAKSKISKGRKL